MAEPYPEKGIPRCCVCYIWRNYSTFPFNETIILYFKYVVIISSTLSASSVWLSRAPPSLFAILSRSSAYRPSTRPSDPKKTFLRTQNNSCFPRIAGGLLFRPPPRPQQAEAHKKGAGLMPSPPLAVSIRMVPVKDPSHRALYCRAKDESSA